MGQSNSEFLKMIQSLTALTQATGSMPGLNLSDILTDSESNEDEAPKYDSKKIPVKIKDVEFMRKYVKGGKLKITEENAEALLEQDPNCFQGITVEFVDYNDKDYFDDGEDVDGQ